MQTPNGRPMGISKIEGVFDLLKTIELKIKLDRAGIPKEDRLLELTKEQKDELKTLTIGGDIPDHDIFGFKII